MEGEIYVLHILKSVLNLDFGAFYIDSLPSCQSVQLIHNGFQQIKTKGGGKPNGKQVIIAKTWKKGLKN